MSTLTLHEMPSKKIWKTENMQLLQKDFSFICPFGLYLSIVQISFFLFHYPREYQPNLDLSIINAWNFLPGI